MATQRIWLMFSLAAVLVLLAACTLNSPPGIGCESIREQRERDICFSNLNTTDIAVCGNISGESLRAGCYADKAISLRDVGLCANAGVPKTVSYCYSEIS